MNTIPLRLQRRRRELEDLRQTHVDAIRDIDGKLAGIAEAVQAYEDICGMVLAYLRECPHTIDGIADGLKLRPKQVRDALAHWKDRAMVYSVTGGPDGPWKAVGADPQPEPPPTAPPSDDTADRGREPALGLAQDAA